MKTELDRELWDRIASVFDRALDVSGADRSSLLTQMCGSDHTVRREVEAMLEAHERGTGLMAERRLTPGAIERRRIEATLPPGSRVGPYRVEALVGAGGMGDVYRAARADGAYRQTVALKLLRPGYAAAEMVRRFRIEREALARLVHPGIATILDGGALEDGRPYIVLEFVDGVPITTYCEQRGLLLRDRLRLFQRVAGTVQFAHGRLVVHRDIKPSNILVQPDGTPRLLDFGIAKLLDPGDAASLAVATRPELRLLTPEYAAPEQIRGEPPSTATDVYALGVLLFELLAGAKPFPATGRTAAALERAVLETPAPAPSAVVGPRAAARALRGDLDRIVLMALRKEPERRYLSAAQLGEDVERYLAGRPVLARPDSVRYRLAKFVGRNRALVAGGAALALLLAGFAVTATLQARRVARERDRAERERVSAEAVLRVLTDLFERGDPNRYPGGDTLRVTALIDSAEGEIGQLGDDSVRQAALRRAVGRMRAARGEYARAITLLTDAYKERRALFGPSDVEAARIHHEIAQSVTAYRGESAARPMLDSSLTELRQLLGEDHEDVRKATSDLLMVTTDTVAARELLARVAALEQRAPNKDQIEVAARLNARGSQRFDARQHAEAAALFQASLDILTRRLPPEHEYVRTVQRNLAAAVYGTGQLARAESLQRASIVLEDRFPTATATRGMAHEALALTLADAGHLDSAEAYERAAWRLLQAGMAPSNWRVWSAERNLAVIVAGRGRVAEGLALLDSAVVLAGAAPDGAENAGYLMAQRIPFLLRLGRASDASASLAAAEHRLGSSPSVSAEHRADVHRYAAMLALSLGDAAGAAARLRSAASLRNTAGPRPKELELDSCLLGVAQARLGQLAEARPNLDQPCSIYQSRWYADPQILRWVGEARRAVR